MFFILFFGVSGYTQSLFYIHTQKSTISLHLMGIFHVFYFLYPYLACICKSDIQNYILPASAIYSIICLFIQSERLFPDKASISCSVPVNASVSSAIFLLPHCIPSSRIENSTVFCTAVRMFQTGFHENVSLSLSQLSFKKPASCGPPSPLTCHFKCRPDTVRNYSVDSKIPAAYDISRPRGRHGNT